MVDPNKELQEMICRYYQLIDAAAPVAELKVFFDPKGFEIVEDDLIIDSLEKYERWYGTVNRTLADRKHTIEHLELVKDSDGEFSATIQMRFTARTAAKEGNTAESIGVNAQIKENYMLFFHRRTNDMKKHASAILV